MVLVVAVVRRRSPVLAVDTAASVLSKLRVRRTEETLAQSVTALAST